MSFSTSWMCKPRSSVSMNAPFRSGTFLFDLSAQYFMVVAWPCDQLSKVLGRCLRLACRWVLVFFCFLFVFDCRTACDQAFPCGIFYIQLLLT